jgi:hypothetical protein
MFRDYRSCQSAQRLQPEGAEVPPTIEPYPDAPKPVRLLFIGFNPPPGGGLWADDSDTLLETLRWVFVRLGWTHALGGRAFRDDFRTKGFYFIHTVKCFRQKSLPQGAAGQRLVRGSALRHLGSRQHLAAGAPAAPADRR